MKKFKVIKLKDIPIMYKISLCFFFLMLLLITLSCIDFSYYKSDKYNTTLSIVKQMNSQAASELDLYMQDIINLTKTPLFYNNTDTLPKLEESNSKSVFFWEMENNLSNIIENIFSLRKDIHSVFIYNLKGESYYKIKNSSLAKQFDVTNVDWFSESIDKFGKPVSIPTFEMSNLCDGSNKSSLIFGVSRGLVRWESGKVVGVIQINSSIDLLSNMVKKLLIYPGQRVVITDKSGYIIYDTSINNITKILSNASYCDMLDDDNALKQTEINGVKSIITSDTVASTDWKIINIIPLDSLNKNINSLKLRSYLLTTSFVFLGFLFLIIVGKQIVSPINKMAKVMRIVEKGDFDVRVKVDSEDEIGQLSRTFNKMTETIKSLIHEVYIDKIKKKDLELQMLQNQINPHFIYNTLESIHMMAEINNDIQTSMMASSLGSIIRYGLSGKNNLVTVKDEIKNIETYIQLQKIRVENIENFILDIDESLYNHKVIKLILQPLVENAIYHGMDDVEENGEIKILGYKINDNIIFEVIDNGKGMDKNTCDKLNGYINDLNEDFNSIGLRNVNMRIKLYYTDKYGIKIESKKGCGTTVRVILPLNPINDI